ncbi:type II toxin-antitoxin system VapC family toxin [Aurantimonas sp. 22II-16-19i]|uniref:type II toxin-antitoxin system VapC family toxin n=1 Tax=Aurantimonas sp. 22II-16-19i TaxID=1317114 RepID=UPI0009F7CB49|nr:type II toxin-antitoxin system VapC family toxin [Aurantimonas sp. 22II-16-19i]ORE92810.1 putative pilT protein [Aurantimonas sp. 22II-16-19i]
MIVVDASAIVALLLAEEDAEQFRGALAVDPNPMISAPTYLETSIVLGARIGILAKSRIEGLMTLANIEVAPFTEAQAAIAADAWRRYGRGSGSPAKLNFGDCFSYALAVFLAAPLLFKGDDFGATDVTAALSA